jgi:hypothetical protein
MKVPAYNFVLRADFAVLAALAFAVPLCAQAAPTHVIAARKMLYPQRQWSDWHNYPARTVENFYPAPKTVPLDRFGGRLDRSSSKTGFYCTRKIDGRWWLVNPIGHLFLNSAVDAVTPAQSHAPSVEFAKTFGTPEVWMLKTRELLVANGFNGVGAWSDVDLLRSLPQGSSRPMAYTINLDIMSAYGAKRGGTYDVPGHKGYPQNTIFVFDPAFVKFANQFVASKIATYRNDPNLIGYFSDNELPLSRANLDGFLRLPANDPGRQAAERWMLNHRATRPTDALRADFLEFEANRYFSVVYAAIRNADPNHMYLGCRFYGQQLNSPELLRAVGKYAGAISINIYGIWQVDSKMTEMWEHESGRPFIVTEFYAKGEDSGMPNHAGAGWLVHTQDDRGVFYENFVLALLRSRSCVGWHWFKYQDNDPDDPHADASNMDSNKGVVNRLYKPYGPLLSRMRVLNLKMYGIVDAFDAAADKADSTANDALHN